MRGRPARDRGGPVVAAEAPALSAAAKSQPPSSPQVALLPLHRGSWASEDHGQMSVLSVPVTMQLRQRLKILSATTSTSLCAKKEPVCPLVSSATFQ